MSKKLFFLWFFLAVFMANGGVVATAVAQSLTVGSGQGENGDQLTIPVNFSNDANNVVAIQFDIQYDTSLINITSAEAGDDLPSNFSFSSSSPSSGVLRVIISPPIQNPLPPVPSGEIAKLNITITGQSGSADLTLANVSLSDSDGNSVTPAALNNGVITITAPPPATPDITVSTNSINFGYVGIGSSITSNFSIANRGQADLTVSEIISDNSAFSIESPSFPVTITPGESQTVTIRLQCTAAGNQRGTLTINSNDPDNPIVRVSMSATCGEVVATQVPTISQWGGIIFGGLLLVASILGLRRTQIK